MYSKISQKRKGNKDKDVLPINQYLIDNATNISTLPTQTSKPIYERCGAGSTALCVGDKNYYILNNNNNWVFYKQIENVPEEIVSAFADFSDRLKKGIDGQGQIVAGAIAEGYNTTASGINSHAEGQGSDASGRASHAENFGTTASGYASHTEGVSATANNYASHAEGAYTTSSSYASHAEGASTTASGYASHAEGNITTASNYASHAEGDSTTASGYASHAEGEKTVATGQASHASGLATIANGDFSYVIGKCNTEMQRPQANDYAFIVGNGTFDFNTNEATRSNAFAIKWDGTFVLANGTEVSPSQMTALLSNSGNNNNNNNNSTFIVEMTLNNSIYTLNKTWKEIKDAFSSGCVIIHFDDENEHEHNEFWYPITKITMTHDNEYPAYFIYFDTYELSSTNENGYPSYDGSQ